MRRYAARGRGWVQTRQPCARCSRRAASDPLGGVREARGSVSTGFIDGSNEIWQTEVPGLLEGDEPFILQIRLADFTKTLRRNNGVIDPECRNFGFWMAGTYRFSVDDIRFVHDPSLPEFRSGGAAQP